MDQTCGTYEQNMARLEEIVLRLEQGDVPLEESVALFEEGTRIAAQCGKLLDEAEQKITCLTRGEDGTFQETPLEPTNEP